MVVDLFSWKTMKTKQGNKNLPLVGEKHTQIMREVETIQQMILEGQEYYNGMRLPKVQRTGTLYQIKTHALLIAQKIVKSWK